MPAIHLRLLGAFEVTSTARMPRTSSPGTQRLITLLALRDRRVSRAAIAGTLWPEVPTSFAAVCLRSALARLDPAARRTVQLSASGLRLDPRCTVDYRDARARAQSLLDSRPLSNSEDAAGVRRTIALLSLELLPDSYDDWVLAEAEDWRLLRAAALEALAASLGADGRPELAIDAACAAIRNEPLRETAHAALIRLHLLAGNQQEAIRAYERIRIAIDESMQLRPSAMLNELVGGLRA